MHSFHSFLSLRILHSSLKTFTLCGRGARAPRQQRILHSSLFTLHFNRLFTLHLYFINRRRTSSQPPTDFKSTVVVLCFPRRHTFYLMTFIYSNDFMQIQPNTRHPSPFHIVLSYSRPCNRDTLKQPITTFNLSISSTTLFVFRWTSKYITPYRVINA